MYTTPERVSTPNQREYPHQTRGCIHAKPELALTIKLKEVDKSEEEAN